MIYTPQQFIAHYAPYAVACMQQTKFPASVSLAQAALETGWGKAAIQNNLFGVKADSSWTGPKQLVVTTEILSDGNYPFPEVISCTKRADGKYNYVCKDWFRVYLNEADSFADHAQFLKVNSNYKDIEDMLAQWVDGDAEKVCDALEHDHYATGVGYANTLKSIIHYFKLNQYDDAALTPHLVMNNIPKGDENLQANGNNGIG